MYRYLVVTFSYFWLLIRYSRLLLLISCYFLLITRFTFYYERLSIYSILDTCKSNIACVMSWKNIIYKMPKIYQFDSYSPC